MRCDETVAAARALTESERIPLVAVTEETTLARRRGRIVRRRGGEEKLLIHNYTNGRL